MLWVLGLSMCQAAPSHHGSAQPQHIAATSTGWLQVTEIRRNKKEGDTQPWKVVGGPGEGREGGCVRNRVRSAETCRTVSGNANKEKREGGHSPPQYTQVSIQQKMSFESGELEYK